MKNIVRISTGIKYSLAFLVLAFGRYPLSRLVSSKKERGNPTQIHSNESYYIQSDSGNILHVEFDGLKGAQPLIFIHGLNSGLEQWFYQRLYFRKKYRLVLIDLPGHGRSLPPKQFTIEAIVSDVKTIIECFKISDPILYGHSIGGMVTLKYCLRYKKNLHIKGIIIQHSTYTNALKTTILPSLFQSLKEPFIIPFLNFAIRNNNMMWFFVWINFLMGINHLFFRYIYFTGNQTSRQLRYITFISAKNSPATIARGILETLKFDVKNELAEINVPTLVIGAVNDRLTRLMASIYIHRHIERSELNIVNEGHLSLIENPSEVNQAIENFIGKL